MENINPLTILEYEKEIASYRANNLGKKPNKTAKKEEKSEELDNAVSYIESRSRVYGNIITSDLLSLQEGNISYFVELEHRFKTRERIKEKILQKMVVDNQSMREAINGIYDALRYTIIIADEFYIEKVGEYLPKIEQLGYKVIRFRNSWGNEYYQGINVSFIDPDGFKFEIQFHTKENYDIKEIFSREPYNLIRSSNVPNELLIKAHLLRRIYQKRVHIPENALSYQYESKSKKRSRSLDFF